MAPLELEDARMTPKPLPQCIASYDLLKVAALLLMIADHTGLYFFHGNEWLKLIGRFCVPMWFFLIGFARSRDIGPKLWFALGLLTVLHVATWKYVFPLDVLATIIVIRLCLDTVMKYAVPSPLILVAFCMVMQVFMWPSMMMVDYGAGGIFLAMLGWFLRKRREPGAGEATPAYVLPIFTIFVFLSFVVQQVRLASFHQVQLVVLVVGSAAVFWVLFKFRSDTYPHLTSVLGLNISGIIRFCGRRTLEIYVAQWIILTGLAMLSHPAHFAGRHFSLMFH